MYVIISVEDVITCRKYLSPEELSEPKTGTARTVLCTNRNRTEPGSP